MSVNCIDCAKIHMKEEEIKENPLIENKSIHSHFYQATMDIERMVVVFDEEPDIE